MTTVHAMVNKLFTTLLFYTLPNPRSKEQSASWVPITIHLTLKQLWLHVCAGHTHAGHRVMLYLGCFVQISIRLCTLQKHFNKIYKFPKLILVFSTFSQAQQSRNELIAPTRLPCLHFSRLYWTDYMSAGLVREKILVNKWTQDVLLILFCSSAWNGEMNI